MIHQSLAGCVGNTPLIRLNKLFPGRDVIAKLEYLSPIGSIKDRPARYIIEEWFRDGTISEGTRLIESSSGNLGVGVAAMAHIYNLEFTCVVDPNISKINLQILKIFGADIDMVTEKDSKGGYLETRIERVKQLTKELPNSVWINQYANSLNWQSHYHGTGSEIVEHMDKPVDYLILAVSTTGTILGVSRRLKEEYPNMKVIAVDAVGSVISGAPSAPRYIPGIGASRVPELYHADEIDEFVHVTDSESVEGCNALVKHEAIFAGGSSGSIVAGMKKIIHQLPENARIVTLFPDRGERYLDTVYDNEWLVDVVGEEPLSLTA